MLDRFLKPLLTPGRDSRRWKVFWAILLLGAPVALWAGFQLQKIEDANRRFRFDVSREQALSRARRKAAEVLGFTPTGWRQFVDFNYHPNLARYLRDRAPGRGRPPGQKKGPPPGAPASPIQGARIASPAEVRVTLMDRERERWFRARLSPQGQLIGWSAGGRQFQASGSLPPPEQARQIAENSLEDWIGEERAMRLGEPEMQRTEDAGAGSAYLFTWRASTPRLPDLEFVFNSEIQGRSVIRQEVTPVFTGSYEESVLKRRKSTDDLFLILRLLFGALFLSYAGWRYARRTLEKEAPHFRTALLAALVFLSGLMMLLVDASFLAARLDVTLLRPPIGAIVVISVVMSFALQGLALGVAYGAGETEIRERFPGAMTATDALLCGKVFSRNIGVAALTGVAAGCWAFLLLNTLNSLVTSEPPRIPAAQLAFTFVRAPLAFLFVQTPIACLFVAVTGLMLPLTFLSRHIRNRRWFYLLLVLGTVIGANLYDSTDQGLLGYLAEAAAVSTAILVPFFVRDFLSCVVSVTVMTLLGQTGDLGGISAVWQGQEGLVLGLLCAPPLVLSAAAWWGRNVSEEEVRPRHAANLAERLSLQAEMAAAREAQQRLMPGLLPSVPGLSIAAASIPAREVSEDFYDFIPLADGNVAVVIGEGGNDGLASALTIALTKGYILYRASRGQPAMDDAAKLLEGLESELGVMLRRDSSATSLALVIIDPARGQCSVARAGPWPVVLAVHRDGTIEELSGAGQSRTLTPERKSLQPGDSVVIYTDGVAKAVEAAASISAHEVLRAAALLPEVNTAGDLHRALLQAAGGPAGQGRVLTNDLTAVVVRFEGQAGGRLESAA